MEKTGLGREALNPEYFSERGRQGFQDTMFGSKVLQFNP